MEAKEKIDSMLDGLVDDVTEEEFKEAHFTFTSRCLLAPVKSGMSFVSNITKTFMLVPYADMANHAGEANNVE